MNMRFRHNPDTGMVKASDRDNRYRENIHTNNNEIPENNKAQYGQPKEGTGMYGAILGDIIG